MKQFVRLCLHLHIAELVSFWRDLSENFKLPKKISIDFKKKNRKKIRETLFTFKLQSVEFLPFLDGSWAIQSQILVAPNS